MNNIGNLTAMMSAGNCCRHLLSYRLNLLVSLKALGLKPLPSAMARCPRCGKQFASESSVLQHMNQPLSACTTFTKELVTISDTLSTFWAQSHRSQVRPSSSQREPSESSRSSDDHDSPPLSPMDLDNQSPTCNNPSTCLSTSPHIEVHPTAGKILGQGTTFMDDFGADMYAQEWSELPYYPFTSQDKWQLASFLLRSSLSMKSINMFLSLNMVCFKFSHLQYNTLIFS